MSEWLGMLCLHTLLWRGVSDGANTETYMGANQNAYDAGANYTGAHQKAYATSHQKGSHSCANNGASILGEAK